MARYSKGAILASLMGAIVFGSYLPDIDHFLTFPYQIHYATVAKGYGHVIFVYLGMAIISGLGIAYFGRHRGNGVLRRAK